MCLQHGQPPLLDMCIASTHATQAPTCIALSCRQVSLCAACLPPQELAAEDNPDMLPARRAGLFKMVTQQREAYYTLQVGALAELGVLTLSFELLRMRGRSQQQRRQGRDSYPARRSCYRY